MADVLARRQLNNLKGEFVKVYKDSLTGCDETAIDRIFSRWCEDRIGKDVDYLDLAVWRREWFDRCWEFLTAVRDCF